MTPHLISETFKSKNSISFQFLVFCILAPCLILVRKIPQPSMDSQVTFYSDVGYSFLNKKNVVQSPISRICTKIQLYPNFGILCFDAIF